MKSIYIGEWYFGRFNISMTIWWKASTRSSRDRRRSSFWQLGQYLRIIRSGEMFGSLQRLKATYIMLDDSHIQDNYVWVIFNFDSIFAGGHSETWWSSCCRFRYIQLNIIEPPLMTQVASQKTDTFRNRIFHPRLHILPLPPWESPDPRPRWVAARSFPRLGSVFVPGRELIIHYTK